MELVDLDVSILIFIKLIEAVLDSEATLDEYLNKMVKYFILSVLDLSLLLNLSHTLDVVTLVELFEFLEGHDAILIFINLIKEGTSVLVLDREIK